MTSAQPIVKWAGGKRRLAEQILAALPPGDLGTYHEPFCGGAAVYLALWSAGRITGARLSDTCRGLILAYQELARSVDDQSDDLLDTLYVLSKQHTKRRFLKVRQWWSTPAPHDPTSRAAAFIYLARSGFNGLWRENLSGGYNTPWGDQPASAVYQPDVLRAAAPAFRAAMLSCQPWHTALDACVPGDTVYLDPPYDSERQGFTAYSGRWSRSDTMQLFTRARQLAAAGVRVLMSNADTAYVRELAAGLDVTELSARRSVGASAASRGRARELLIRF